MLVGLRVIHLFERFMTATLGDASGVAGPAEGAFLRNTSSAPLVPAAVRDFFADPAAYPLRAIIDAALEGRHGEVVWATNADGLPLAARIDLGCYSIFAGASSDEAASNLLHFRRPNGMPPLVHHSGREIVVPTDPKLPCAETTPKRTWAQSVDRLFAFPSLSLPHSASSFVVEGWESMHVLVPGPELRTRCESAVAALPASTALVALSDWPQAHLAELNLDRVGLGPNGSCVFGSAERLASAGLAFAAVTIDQNEAAGSVHWPSAEEILCLSTTYALSSSAAEISIATMPQHRGRGLASATASRLVLECLTRGLTPYWSTANPASLRIAERLGFVHCGISTGFRLRAATQSQR